MKPLKVVAKELNVKADKIKNLIKENLIEFENKSGVFFVDVDEVRKIFNSDNSDIEIKIPFNKYNTIDNYIDDWESVIGYNYNSVSCKQFGGDFYEINSFITHVSNFQNHIPVEKVLELTQKLKDVFGRFDNYDFHNGPNTKYHNVLFNAHLYIEDGADILDYAVVELDGYLITFHSDLMNGLYYTINNIVDMNTIDFKKPLSYLSNKDVYKYHERKLVMKKQCRS